MNKEMLNGDFWKSYFILQIITQIASIAILHYQENIGRRLDAF